MNDVEQRAAAKKFIADWQGKGYEKGDTQKFWIDLLGDVLGVEHPTKFIHFEEQIRLGPTGFVDGRIPETKILIEQKSCGKRLDQAIKQSDGSVLTPFQQAKRYAEQYSYSLRPRWIVTCNFQEFNVYDMEKPFGEPEIIYLKDLEDEYYRLQFIVDKQNEHVEKEKQISIEAGRLVGHLYEALLSKYNDSTNEDSLKSLNMLCVRLVFCFYAEDAGVFNHRNQFYNYLKQYDTKNFRRALIELFKVLSTPENQRDPYLEEDLADFPYVNGGLFNNVEIEIPQFDDEIRDIILNQASGDFDWSKISPTIFGAVFESTLNPETRRGSGMHYTSIENIHKVIDPLFLDNLREELDLAKGKSISGGARTKALTSLHNKISSLKFLDPACGSGNFLTETYLCLRRIENEILKIELSDSSVWGTQEVTVNQILLFGTPIKVNLDQFYGIEINDFAVSVARTALWIAESQMMKETEDIIAKSLDFLPLVTLSNITEGNALEIDWEKVVPKSELNYIMGNPPFIGARLMEQGGKQKREVESTFGNIKDVQDLDYVTCWYKLAAKMIQGTKIEVSFVSTNSIAQGSQVPILWGILFGEYYVRINFAYQTFKWGSESNDPAAVHCVIIGFALFDKEEKLLFNSNGTFRKVNNISPYLFEGNDSFVTARKEPLCNVPKMNFGNQPRDGGNFILTVEERDALLNKEPELIKWIRVYMGAEEFIKGKRRYCLWLADASPNDIKKSKTLYDCVEKVRNFRLESKAKTTNGYAKVPHCFAQITQPKGADYLLIPRVSSERRKYAPIGFLKSETISSDAVQIVPNAELYHFGILTSNVHMAWMRAVAGRLKSDYRYSKEIVYNNFPWCNPTEAQRAKIEKTAQKILDARAMNPDSSLATLYDENLMPIALRNAHRANDKAVMEAYGFYGRNMTESECVAELMKMYQELTKE